MLRVPSRNCRPCQGFQAIEYGADVQAGALFASLAAPALAISACFTFVDGPPNCSCPRNQPMKTHAIQFTRTGGPEVLEKTTLELKEPGEGEVLLAQTAIGLNFIDVYHRTGLYPVPLPSVPGVEAAGVVEKVGSGVEGLSPGDRVAYAGGSLGAYAAHRIVPAEWLVKVPDAVSNRVAAASMLKGMTAEYLLRRTYQVKPGDTILFHAAAGGTGSIACRWARHLGATVIGVVGSDEKAQQAQDNGCHHVIVRSHEDFTARTLEITNGAGVQAVYDSVGRTTFDGSIGCLAARGILVLFGQSSGPVESINPAVLAKGSYYLTRPSLFQYNASRSELEQSAAALFDVLASGAVRVPAPTERALSEAAAAHRALEARETTGATVLVP